MRLLVIEDNRRLAALIRKALIEQAFVVDAVQTAADAEAALRGVNYDLILLDLALPDADGEDILRALRARGMAVRVLVITARADVLDRVRLLDAGADDYLVKPFLLEELLARVRALLRRPPPIAGSLHRAGNVVVDAVALAVTIGAEPAELPRRELAVLLALVRNQGRVLPRHALVDAVYSFDSDVTPNAIEATISRLRRRLATMGADVTITAMRGLGYIMAPVSAPADGN